MTEAVKQSLFASTQKTEEYQSSCVGPRWLNEFDYLTTHTRLSPIRRREFVPDL